MKLQDSETWILCGASSGLGKAFAELVSSRHPEIQVVFFSRRSDVTADFSREADWPVVLERIETLRPTRLFYFAGGGPWGSYRDKKWSSHEWTYRVNFLFPAFLLSQLKVSSLKQMLFIGSSVAESAPDVGAASYAAAKHALRGLVTTVQAERSAGFDIRLLSPGYMDTPLLPAHAWPRQKAGLVQDPSAVAARALSWVQDVHSANGHLILS